MKHNLLTITVDQGWLRSTRKLIIKEPREVQASNGFLSVQGGYCETTGEHIGSFNLNLKLVRGWQLD